MTGPRATVWGGAAFCAVGYAAMYAAWQRAPGVATSAGAMAFYVFLWQHGSAWLDIANVSSAVANFPRDRGLAIGLIKALFGLSSSLIALVYSNAIKPNAVALMPRPRRSGSRR